MLPVSAIVPVRHPDEALHCCLAALVEATGARDEIVVVVDGEGDPGWILVCSERVRVLTTGSQRGPAAARNVGARAASGEVLLFVDSDVVVTEDTVGRVREVFETEPAVAALFGSYDDAPAGEGFISQYRNLLHHYTHQMARETVTTFWAGCGAVRRDVFLRAGGFDERYRHPCIEDIELGYRLSERGHRIRLDKQLQVKHLKRWTVTSMVVTDIRSRALPWAELLLRNRHIEDNLNVSRASRLSAVLVLLFCAGLGSLGWSQSLVGLTTLAAVLLLLVNLRFYRFLQKRRGVLFAVCAVPWHWFYFLYAGLAFGLAAVRHTGRLLAAWPLGMFQSRTIA